MAQNGAAISPQQLADLLCAHEPGLQALPHDDVTLEFCARLASEAASSLHGTSMPPGPVPVEVLDAAQTVVDLLNDLARAWRSSAAGQAPDTPTPPLMQAGHIVALLQSAHQPLAGAAPAAPSASNTASPVASASAAADGAQVWTGPPAASTSAGSRAKAGPGGARWNVAAAEFVPGGLAPAAAPPAAVQQSGAAEAGSSDHGPFSELQGGVAASASAPHDVFGGWWDDLASHPPHPLGWTQPSADAAGGPLELLSSMFPHYSPALLTQLLEARGHDLAAAVDELLLLDALPATALPCPATTHVPKASGHSTLPLPAQLGMSLEDPEAFPALLGPRGDHAVPATMWAEAPGGPADAPALTKRPQQQQDAVGSDTGGGDSGGGSGGAFGVNGVGWGDGVGVAGPARGGRAHGKGKPGVVSLADLLAGLPAVPAAPSAAATRVARATSAAPSSSSSSWASKAGAAPHPVAAAHPPQAARPSPTAHVGVAPTAVSRAGVAGWQGVPRVATGEALAAQYAAVRQEASDWARARNMCFQEATKAYLGGNKALAKELSARGKAHAARMWAAHELAAQSLMMQRAAMRSVPGGPLMLDLHGLHIREALAVLQRQLGEGGALAATHGDPGMLHVVVGVGKHSKVAASQGRLLAAVEQELQRLGLGYTQPQPGLLAVRLPPH